MTEIELFGCSLDPDEREQSIRRKVAYIQSGINRGFDPYDQILKLKDILKKDNLKNEGKVDVETWLTPFPRSSDLPFMTLQNFIAFVDSGGCLDYSTNVYKYVKNKILPNIPLLIGVDHSLTGGVLKSISEEYGREDLLVIFVDSHYDGISMKRRLDLIEYEIEKSNNSVYSKKDPYLYDRPDSYNAESFIKFLVKDRIILPENTVCLGVSDYPSEKTASIEDNRVKDYVNEFKNMESKGLEIITKNKIRSEPTSLEKVLRRKDIENVYVSIDLDIGANATTMGVRFLDGYIGMKIKEIKIIMKKIADYISNDKNLIGFDLMEFDMHKADESTFSLALTVISQLLKT